MTTVETASGRAPASLARDARATPRTRARPRIPTELSTFRPIAHLRQHSFILSVLLVALLLGEVPLLIAGCCAPQGASGLGSVWFINDFAQYESAMRQGAEGSGWLVYDVFTAEPHRPALMFPLYVALGKLGSALHTEPMLLERVVEVASHGLLVLALWRFARAFSPSGWAARAAVLLALFGSGFEVLAAMLGRDALYTGSWSYETNTFGLLFGAPHVALAMAATLELARLTLAQANLTRVQADRRRAQADRTPAQPDLSLARSDLPLGQATLPLGRCELMHAQAHLARGAPGRDSLEGQYAALRVAHARPPRSSALDTRLSALWSALLGRAALAALLSASIALLNPFHLPVLLAAALILGAVRRSAARLAVAAAACLGALPVLAITVFTFSMDPFWSATYTAQNVLPSPPLPGLLVDLGTPVLLAAAGLVILRTNVAPPGLLMWLSLAVIAMYVPVPYQRRLGFGLQPGLVVLAASGLLALSEKLGRVRAQWLRLGIVALAGHGTILVLVSIVASGLTDSPLSIYRASVDVDRAAAWLDQHAQPGEVILANWELSNYLGPRTPARVVGGHPVATLDAAAKQVEISTAFGNSGDPLAVARQQQADWIVESPEDTPAIAPPAADLAFTSGGVHVYHVASERHTAVATAT